MNDTSTVLDRQESRLKWHGRILAASLLFLILLSALAIPGWLARNLGALYLSHATMASDRSQTLMLAQQAVSVSQFAQGEQADTRGAERLQIRALMLLGDYPAALTRLSAWLPRVPGETADREIRNALLHLAQDQSDALFEKNRALTNLAALLTNKVRSFDHYLMQADHLLASGNYVEASGLFQLAQALSPSPDPAIDFQVAIASVLAGANSPLMLQSGAANVFDITGGGRVEGEHLQWLHHDSTYHVQPGTELSMFPAADAAIGVLWWGQPAAAIIWTEQANCYAVTVRARQVGASSGSFQIAVDRTNPKTVLLTPEWNSEVVQLCLSPGYHLLQITADDRAGDVEVDWIEFQRNWEVERPE